ncbi:MAG: DMT family transporter [Chloroflexi bacterium]|nr:DMT family transporter [Chloroflexota bacterium]
MKIRSFSIPPYLALVSGILALSMTSLFVRWAQAPGTVTAAYRMSISVLVLTPFVLRSKNKLSVNSSNWWVIVLIAGAFVALDHGTMSTAIGLTRIANSTLLNNLAPLWVALFAYLVWHEKLKKWFWIGLILTMVGAVIILGSDLARHPQLGLGDGIAFLSSFFYAGYFLITQLGRQKIPALQYVWTVNVVSAIFLILFNLLSGIPLTGYSLQTYLVFIGAGLISQTIGYFSITYALGHLPASVVSPTMVIQIVLTSLLAIPIFGERLSIAQLIGGAAVLGGILLVNLTKESPNKKPLKTAIALPKIADPEC